MRSRSRRRLPHTSTTVHISVSYTQLIAMRLQSFNVTRSRLSQISHLDMRHLVLGINFQIHSVSLTSLVSIHLVIHLSTHLSHHPRSHHPSRFHSFTPGSKPTFSINPSHLRLLLPIGLPHDNGTGPDRTYHAHHFIFSFAFYFLFIPCGRLTWLPVSFLPHVKYTLNIIVSYRIPAGGYSIEERHAVGLYIYASVRPQKWPHLLHRHVKTVTCSITVPK